MCSPASTILGPRWQHLHLTLWPSTSHQATLPCHVSTLPMILFLLVPLPSCCCQPFISFCFLLLSHFASSLQKWPRFLTPPCAFQAFPWKVRIYFPSPGILAVLWLSLVIEYGRSDLVPVLSPVLKRPCMFLFIVLETFWASVSTIPGYPARWQGLYGPITFGTLVEPVNS